MSSLMLLIPLSLLIIVLAVGLFFWAVRSGQYDDLDSPACRIVLDDDRQPKASRQDYPPEDNPADED